MSHNIVILLLGSNLGNRDFNLREAEIRISKEIGEIISKSETIETKAVDFETPNKFLNRALKIQTLLSPFTLLKAVKSIESGMGRTYLQTNQKYQDRLIDVDILTFNQITFESRFLKIPHHQIITRAFVHKIIRL